MSDELTEKQKMLQQELIKILDDNYARGAFVGMCTKIYFDIINAGTISGKENTLGIDTIISNALEIRIKAYEMAGLRTPTPQPKIPTLKETPSPEPEPEKKGIKLVM